MSLFLVLLAAGDGKRLKSITPKLYHKVNNKTLLEHSLDTFKNFPEIKKTVIVYNKKHKRYLNKLKLKNNLKIIGGRTRQESTFKALKKIKKMNCNKILIHDAVRPFVTNELIENVLESLDRFECVIPAINIDDTLKEINSENFVERTVDRNNFVRVQTPQGFRASIIKYYKEVIDKDINFTDDSMVVEYLGKKVKIINGDKKNIKITTPDDLIVKN